MTGDTLELAHAIVDVLDEKKGENILLLDLVGVCSFTDYFVICTGGSERTIRALAQAVSERVKEEFDLKAQNTEGEPSSGWVLLDYGDLILHLFSTRKRDYYRLEDLWRIGNVLLHLQ
jgi:ribosome-associated protein